MLPARGQPNQFDLSVNVFTPVGLYDCTTFQNTLAFPKIISIDTRTSGALLAGNSATSCLLAAEQISSYFTPNIVCLPFKKLPPYQCTSKESLSTLTILSQSFALTTTAIGVLFFTLALLVKFRHIKGDGLLHFDTIYSAKAPANIESQSVSR